MTFQTISALPALPADGATGDDFNDPAIAFLEALSVFQTEINTLTGQYAAFVTSSLSATSSTSNSIAGSGNKTFTVAAGLAFSAGQPIVAASVSGPTNYMIGTVYSYSGTTLIITVASSGGSGTKTDWAIGLIPSVASLAAYALTSDVPELARDAIGTALTGSTGLSVTPNDGGDTITLALTGGVAEIPIPATAMTPRTTNGAALGSSESTTNKIMTETLDFDQSTAEYAQLRFFMPKRWNEGTVKAQFYWTAGATGNVIWGCQAVALSDDDVFDAAFGTAQTVTDGVTASGDLMVSAQTSAITVGGTPAAGDLVVFQFYRDAANGSDTLAADAKLLGVKLILTTDAADDS